MVIKCVAEKGIQTAKKGMQIAKKGMRAAKKGIRIPKKLFLKRYHNNKSIKNDKNV
jgi:hypothetical protein